MGSVLGKPPRWVLGGVSLQGVSHISSETPCQDNHKFCVLEDDWIVIAVSDGAGSASESEKGSKAIVDAVIQYFEAEGGALTAEDVVQHVEEAVSSARDALVYLSLFEEKPLKEFSATCIVAVAHPDGICVGHVGDGGVVVREPGGRLHTVSWPTKGDYSNFTSMLSSGDWREQLRVTFLHGALADVAVFTDGIEDEVLEAGEGGEPWTPYPQFFDPVFDYVGAPDRDIEAAATAVLTSPNIREKSHDDLTVVFAVLRKAKPGSEEFRLERCKTPASELNRLHEVAQSVGEGDTDDRLSVACGEEPLPASEAPLDAPPSTPDPTPDDPLGSSGSGTTP
jgi:serine/threonine protein phosphatase PrpC